MAAIIVVTRTLAEDRTTGLSATVAAGPLGEFGHVLGRWAGGALVGASCSVPPIISSVALSNHMHLVGGYSLHDAPIYSAVSLFTEILLVGAWAALLSHVLSPAPAVVGAALVAVLGRVLSTPAVLGILPQPIDHYGSTGGPTPLASWTVEIVATGGVLLLAAWMARRVSSE